ncbi:hypothetical protein ASZ90_011481 [hydrocarbon metagenome]|uniref:Uncharacterized protein n=1 Tax=hydrocarbon metagenome TaxID=938273 RepID=A0A0W8FD56_9ZZZZ
MNGGLSAMRGFIFGLKRRPRFMAEKRALETLKLWVEGSKSQMR